MAESVTASRPEDLPRPNASTAEPLTNLRGAKHGLDTRRVGVVAGALCLAGVIVLVVALFVAAADRNARITDLRARGIRIEATVTGCRGLLGGSGSNAAGYACFGTIIVDGHRYSEGIPGNTLYATGAKVSLVTVPGDPGLISTPRELMSERTSWKVFILPSVLVLVVLTGGGLLAAKRRSKVQRACG